MAKNQKPVAAKTTAVKKPKTPKVSPATTPVEDYDVRESLMPELEALVKKNPNRLIGCGG